jgi:hypothetical protein
MAGEWLLPHKKTAGPKTQSGRTEEVLNSILLSIHTPAVSHLRGATKAAGQGIRKALRASGNKELTG